MRTINQQSSSRRRSFSNSRMKTDRIDIQECLLKTILLPMLVTFLPFLDFLKLLRRCLKSSCIERQARKQDTCGEVIRFQHFYFICPTLRFSIFSKQPTEPRLLIPIWHKKRREADGSIISLTCGL